MSAIDDSNALPERILPRADIHLISQKRTEKKTLMWTIKDFGSLIKQEKTFVSTKDFYIHHARYVQWQLMLKASTEDLNLLDIYFCENSRLDGHWYDNIEVSAQISILNTASEKLYVSTMPKSDKYSKSCSSTTVYLKENFISKTVLTESKFSLFPTDTLTLFCEISQSGYLTGEIENYNFDYEKEFSDFSKLFENPTFADTIFNVSGTVFKVHKAVVAARSPVFWAMFNPENQMIEQENNSVKIEDIQPQVFRELLRYMYTGTVESIENIVHELLIAANKYCMEQLGKFCEKTMYEIMRVENALDILLTADQLEKNHLKQKVLEFIVSNLASINDLESWNKMLKTHSHLATQIIGMKMAKFF